MLAELDRILALAERPTAQAEFESLFADPEEHKRVSAEGGADFGQLLNALCTVKHFYRPARSAAKARPRPEQGGPV